MTEKVDQWHWEYIKVKNLPNFYRIWDNENNTIAHIELRKSDEIDGRISEICESYNQLKKSEALWQWANR